MTITDVRNDVRTEDVVCDNGMPAFLAYPSASGRFPIVVLIHERYGLVKHTKDLATRCARDGFIAMAPNMFFKHPDPVKLNAGASRYDITDPEAIEYLEVAVAKAKQNRGADPSKIAVAGYCQTGRHPLVFAAVVPVQAVVVWYGAASKREWGINDRQPKPLQDVIAKVPCPVFGAFGEADHIISVEDVLRLRQCLEQNKKSYEIHIYRDAPHGWLNDTMPGRYRKAQAEAAWADQQRFLGGVFGGAWDAKSIMSRFDADIRPDYDFSKNVRLE